LEIQFFLQCVLQDYQFLNLCITDVDSLSSQVESAKSGNELAHNETMAQFESRINKLKEERDQFYGVVQEREIQIEQMQKVDDEKSEEVILLKQEIEERSQEVALFKQDVYFLPKSCLFQ
jgi:peptidoglycan hydrolase CwlO-like protein